MIAVAHAMPGAHCSNKDFQVSGQVEVTLQQMWFTQVYVIALTKLVRKAHEEQSSLHGVHTMHNAGRNKTNEASSPTGRREKDHLHA